MMLNTQDLVIFGAFLITFIIALAFVKGANKIWSAFIIAIFFSFIGYNLNIPFMNIGTISLVVLFVSMLIVYKLFLSDNAEAAIE